MKALAGPRCQGTKKDGEPCNAGATRESGYTKCPFHSETISDEQKLEWQTRGGNASRPGTLAADAPNVQFRSAADCIAVLEDVASRVRRGELAPSIAREISNAVSVAIKVVEAGLDDRLYKLEKILRREGR